MSDELKEFFKEIKDSEDYFLFWRLYHDPGSILGTKQDMEEAEEEYNNLYYYCKLMMNNNLTKFIRLVLRDGNFVARNDVQTWRKLNFFLYDSADFKKYYDMLDDHDVVLALNDKMPVREYLRRIKSRDEDKRPKMPLFDMYEASKKYKRLFDYNYPREQIENYDEKLSKEARWYVQLRLEVLKETVIDREENKRLALKWIEEDDYSEGSDLDNTYLNRYRLSLFYSRRVLEDLVCENRFLDIIEYKIDEGTIYGAPLENALNIILTGIYIKKREVEDFEYFQKRLGEKIIREFDLNKAEALVSKITLYKIKKEKKQGIVLQFPNAQ